MNDVWDKSMKYAADNPVKFIGMCSFFTLGAVPLMVFLAYAIATLVASLVGAIVVELFLLALGITGLAIVLFFVSCLSLCVTAIFTAAYFTYHTVSSNVKKSRNMKFPYMWPLSTSSTDFSDPPQPGQVESDKKKIRSDDSILSTELSESSHSSHDFIRTALFTLSLVTSIFVASLCVLIVACCVIHFT